MSNDVLYMSICIMAAILVFVLIVMWKNRTSAPTTNLREKKQKERTAYEERVDRALAELKIEEELEKESVHRDDHSRL